MLRRGLHPIGCANMQVMQVLKQQALLNEHYSVEAAPEYPPSAAFLLENWAAPTSRGLMAACSAADNLITKVDPSDSILTYLSQSSLCNACIDHISKGVGICPTPLVHLSVMQGWISTRTA